MRKLLDLFRRKRPLVQYCEPQRDAIIRPHLHPHETLFYGARALEVTTYMVRFGPYHDEWALIPPYLDVQVDDILIIACSPASFARVVAAIREA